MDWYGLETHEREYDENWRRSYSSLESAIYSRPPLDNKFIWRGCAAAHESVNNAWVPILEQPTKASEEHEDESQSTEEDEALAELFKVKMMEIPWVKAAARAAKRQDKAKKQREKKKKKWVSSKKDGEDV
jgi:hypothetical protein